MYTICWLVRDSGSFLHYGGLITNSDFQKSFFGADIFKNMRKETNLYVAQQINKKQQECPLK
jgi:hypothetical protein